ncbi:hypothetical protein ACTMUQ_09215 [Streptomyces sp. SD11]|uniref:hypothetical protein n=1 Tax=Streptomyces sp. SD11 TaxID=3452209 RepID=UPI003F8A5BB2
MTTSPERIVTSQTGDAVRMASYNSATQEAEMAQGEQVRVPDVAEAARRARFGSLPERVRLADTVEERPATVLDPARNAYNDDEWLVRTCI